MAGGDLMAASLEPTVWTGGPFTWTVTPVDHEADTARIVAISDAIRREAWVHRQHVAQLADGSIWHADYATVPDGRGGWGPWVRTNTHSFERYVRHRRGL